MRFLDRGAIPIDIRLMKTQSPGFPVVPDQASQARRDHRAKILAAAERVFARGGLDSVRMVEIATEARLPKANVHYYFGTKERLYEAVLLDVVGQWLRSARAWIVPGRHPAEALAGYVRARLADARSRPEAPRIFASEMLRGAPLMRPFLNGELRQSVAEMGRVIDDWVARGLMDRVAPEHLFFSIWAMTRNYADFEVQIRAVLGSQASEDEIFRAAEATLVALVLGGCGVRDASAAPLAS